MLPSNTQLWQQFCPPSSWQVKYRISQGMTSPAELICSSASSSLSLRYSSAVVVSCSDRWTRLLAQTVRVSLALQTNFWAVLPATKQKRSWRVRVIEMSQSERFIIYIVQMNENQSIGMMEGAFFVPKSDLLAWVNSTLQLEVKQIEQLGTGAIYCQLIDAMYPGKIAMARVNWRARNEWEFISNFKVLQQGFGKCKIQKYIDIEKLSKGKYQDNLEFVQWLKRYFDLHNKNDLSNYDAPTARKNAQVDLSFVDIRNPLKARQKDQNESNQNLRKARSPYDNVKSKLNNRSLSLARPKHQSEYFIDKLSQIKNILKNAKKEEKLARIEQILESVEELPRKEETMGDLQKSESKNVLGKEDSKKGGEKDDDPKKAVVKRRKGKD